MKLRARRALRILDFDTECRPMHYSEWRPESQITAYAWSWVGEDKVYCELLDQDLTNEEDILLNFLDAYNEADIVTGHYIRRHDLPLLNDHSVRLLGRPIQGKLVSDTKCDLVAAKGLGMSQENLATEFNVSADKHHMIGSAWRLANTLSPEGQATARKRVVDDVLQNKQLRVALLERGMLKTPRRWSP